MNYEDSVDEDKVMPRAPFDVSCKAIRKNMNLILRDIDRLVSDVKKLTVYGTDGSDKGEMIANLMLAKRHAEDVRQRTGLAIKAWDGGKSAYTD